MMKTDWNPVESAPTNTRLLVAGDDEMAMGWLDRIDNRWYYAPQGGWITWEITQWMHPPLI